MDHFSGNPQAGCRVTCPEADRYPIFRQITSLLAIRACTHQSGLTRCAFDNAHHCEADDDAPRLKLPTNNKESDLEWAGVGRF
jgi:hypothetical protein